MRAPARLAFAPGDLFLASTTLLADRPCLHAHRLYPCSDRAPTNHTVHDSSRDGGLIQAGVIVIHDVKEVEEVHRI